MQTARHVLVRMLLAFASRRCHRLVAAAVIATVAAAASQSASAQGRGRGPVLNLPTASEAAPAATVISEAPFQEFTLLNCEGAHCRFDFPALAAKERLVIQFASCNATLTAGDLQSFVLAVTNVKGTRLFGAHFVAPSYQSSGPVIHFVASQPMLLTVEASRVLHLQASAYGGDVTYAACGVSGVRQKLG